MTEQTIEIPAAAWRVGAGSTAAIVHWTQSCIHIARPDGHIATHRTPREADTPRAGFAHALASLPPGDPDAAVLQAVIAKIGPKADGAVA